LEGLDWGPSRTPGEGVQIIGNHENSKGKDYQRSCRNQKKIQTVRAQGSLSRRKHVKRNVVNVREDWEGAGRDSFSKEGKGEIAY